MADQSRRQALQIGGTILLSGLAGCSGVTDQLTGGDEEETHEPTATPHPQEYTLPPVVSFIGDGIPDDGIVTVRAGFETATTPGDPNLYFEDEITFELFVYTTFPVGNSVELTKVAEKTNAPYNQVNEPFEIPYEDLPKNKQMRFRLRVTNNNTGDTEWAMDQRLFHYLEFGDNFSVARNDGQYSMIEGPDGWTSTTFVDDLEEGKYVLNYSADNEYPSSDLPEEIPFSREAYKLENDLYRNNNEPMCWPSGGVRIEMPESHVEMTEELMRSSGVGDYYNGFTFTGNVPSEYDYYGRNQYNVLDHPIYQKMADAVIEAQGSYGVENHYARIDEATRMIQVQEYDAITGSIRTAPIHLPEAYWADPGENCVGMSFQLCWYLYHLGYTCGTVWLDRSGRNASHLGVGIPVPEEVIESDFPDGYLDTLESPDVPSATYIENISEIVGPDSRPETLGEHPWVYIEATDPTSIGVIPFETDTIQERRVRFAIEPEDNVFGTDIGAPNNR
ncbi:hypothetical protein [Halobacterium salinarum]|uniref:hypothetical protein n=1 Tax=Halobacterium salinarum TaxID=2242 RepID=UPI002553C28D|nr:hypothetical protein [Halobacterium salinarum]MDL0144118.1 hypothetical protein [Halobacterium salinarum]